MCGIAGIVDYRNKLLKKDVIEGMLRSICYRGPDESGIYSSSFACLGHTRLSIVDLSTGQQPLSDPSGRYWIIFNGEIFNYPELRDLLLKKGNIFRTHSDTEVLVQLYAAYGKDCLSMLNGQFAFAIWDKKSEEVFLARDRIGIRPLFYNTSGDRLAFASEIKSLFALDDISREFSYKKLSDIYTFWTAITPGTAFRDIYELSPGHFLIYNRKGITIGKYWELTYNDTGSILPLNKALDQFNELFYDAVRIRLRADVEVAAYLSGGIDSSSTVAYIKNIEPGVLNTFSIGFDDKNFDESSYQSEAVSYLNTRHKSITCTSKEISEIFPRVIWHTETPVTRTAPAPMLLLSGLVRDNNIKVVITGEGADEMLAGYDIFKEAKIRRFWAKQPDSAIRPKLLKRLNPFLPQMKDANPAILKMFYGYKLEDIDNPFYSHLLRWNNSNHIKKHLTQQVKSEIEGYSPTDHLRENLPAGFDRWNYLEKSQWLETSIFMSGYLLSSQGDRMAMANSVEGRYPFLDYRVIEFCNRLPADYKLHGLNEKYLLKKLMLNKIPDSIIKRAKQPYRAPIKNAFMQSRSEYLKEILSQEYFSKAGIFDFNSISGVLQKIERTGNSTEVDDMILVAVISTHLLYKQFIEGFKENLNGRKLSNLKTIEET
ncbi:MAG: asparagine synthase (glutamine-hydrolyzing) [Bacteroidota bacterium]|nr:asparagine synthase (glutamine-hydrolyzing) [Bacteroidota bacterium]